MNTTLKKQDKLKKYISCAKKSGITILNPSVNESELEFSTVKENVIQMGLYNLKNLGKASIPIIEERKNGKYLNLYDFAKRTLADKKAYEALAYSGALDEFGGSRLSKLELIEQIGEYKKSLNNHKSMWFNLPELDKWFSDLYPFNVPDIPEMEKENMLKKEYEFAGMYVTEHPLEQYQQIVDSFPHENIENLMDSDDDDLEDENGIVVKEEQERPVVVVGVVKELEAKLTKKGDTMLIFNLEDTTGSIRMVLFPKQAKKISNILEDSIIRVDGLWKKDDFGTQVIVENATLITDIVPSKPEKYKVYTTSEKVLDVLQVLDNYSDDSNDSVEVEIVLDDKHFKVLRDSSMQKRAIPSNKNTEHELLRVNSSLSAHAAIREIAKVVSE